MSDATITTATPETLEQRIAALEAKATADVSFIEKFIRGAVAFVQAHWSKAAAAVTGWAVAHYSIIEAVLKLI